MGFALLVGALWVDDEADGLWRAFGCAGIVAIAASHACLVLGSRRQGDSETVRALVAISLLAGAVDATAIIVPVSGLAEYDDDSSPQFLAICLVVLVLTTVLPPILRRLQPRPETSARAPRRTHRAPRRRGGGDREQDRRSGTRPGSANPGDTPRNRGATAPRKALLRLGIWAGKAIRLRWSDC